MAANTPSAIKAAKFCAYLNGAYHADREAHLDGWHRFLMFSVIMLGTSALLEVLPDWARLSASLATAAIGAADLVLNLSVRARTASFLRKGYFDIAAALEEGSLDPPKADAAMLRLISDEEPPYRAAHALAENWATGAVYGDKRPLPCRVSGWRRFTRHFVRHASHNFSVDAPLWWGRRLWDSTFGRVVS
ncbi:MAG TPA: hypothetical protein VIT45_08445 [Allosphingosinicella sp.]